MSRGFLRPDGLGAIMPGDGPFLFLRDGGPPAGFWHTPPGGMCLSTFLFLRRGPEILLGKYGDHASWETLAGLDPERVRNYGRGWTVPARQLKIGEDPRDTARSIGEEILGFPGLAYSEPRVEVDYYEPSFAPGLRHYDVWFFVEATAPVSLSMRTPPWYRELAWRDPRSVSDAEYGRGHQDVVARWLATRTERSRGLADPGASAEDGTRR